MRVPCVRGPGGEFTKMRAHTQSSHRGVSNMCVCVFSTTGQAVNRRTAQSRMHKPSPLSYQSDTLGPEMAGGRNSPCVCGRVERVRI